MLHFRTTMKVYNANFKRPRTQFYCSGKEEKKMFTFMLDSPNNKLLGKVKARVLDWKETNPVLLDILSEWSICYVYIIKLIKLMMAHKKPTRVANYSVVYMCQHMTISLKWFKRLSWQKSIHRNSINKCGKFQANALMRGLHHMLKH